MLQSQSHWLISDLILGLSASSHIPLGNSEAVRGETLAFKWEKPDWFMDSWNEAELRPR